METQVSVVVPYYNKATNVRPPAVRPVHLKRNVVMRVAWLRRRMLVIQVEGED